MTIFDHALPYQVSGQWNLLARQKNLLIPAFSKRFWRVSCLLGGLGRGTPECRKMLWGHIEKRWSKISRRQLSEALAPDYRTWRVFVEPRTSPLVSASHGFWCALQHILHQLDSASQGQSMCSWKFPKLYNWTWSHVLLDWTIKTVRE